MKRYDDGEARGFRSVVARGGGPLVLRALGRAGRGVGSTAGVEGAASEVVVERVLCRMREVVDWRGVDLHAAPLRETRREYGWPSQPWRPGVRAVGHPGVLVAGAEGWRVQGSTAGSTGTGG